MESKKGSTRFSQNDLNTHLEAYLQSSFLIRTKTKRRKTKTSYVFESTFVSDGNRTIYLSGYPGRRDWVANISANPDVTIHSVGNNYGFEIRASASVIKGFDQKLPYLLLFLERWTNWATIPKPVFKLILMSIKVNSRCNLPWWGPFWLAKKILSKMPCVQVRIIGEPIFRSEGAPPVG